MNDKEIKVEEIQTWYSVDTLQTDGRTEGDTRPGRTRQKTKDLSTGESEERGRGESGFAYVTPFLSCSEVVYLDQNKKAKTNH